MSKTKPTPKPKPKPPQDPVDETLRAIVESEDIPPKRSLINKLKLFVVKESAAAQARGVRLGIKVKDEP